MPAAPPGGSRRGWGEARVRAEDRQRRSNWRRGRAPPPAPSPLVPRGEGGEFDPASARSDCARRRPLRARITRPPPPKLLGEVGVAEGGGGSTTGIELVPTEGPSPLVPRGRGEKSIPLRRGPIAPAGAPSGLALLAHLPQNCWGRLVLPMGWRLDDRYRAGADGGPLPARSSRRGENSIPLRRATRWRLIPDLRRGRHSSLLQGCLSAKADFVWLLQRIHSPCHGRSIADTLYRPHRSTACVLSLSPR
jgi:hypothetical protein